MNPKIKLGVAIIIILLFIFASLKYSLQLGKPNPQLTEGFYVTIKGEIITSDDDFDMVTRPNYVVVYHSYSNLDQLCLADSIELAKITWNNESDKGEYTITFWLPIEQEIVITPNCNGCLHERVYVSKNDNIKNINLKWDTSVCRKDVDVFDNADSAYERAIQLLNDVDSELSRRNFNESVKENIKYDIQRGRDEIREMSYSPDENESLNHASLGILFAQNAFYKINTYDLGNCLKDIEKVIESHKDTCYSLPYDGAIDYDTSNSSYFSHLDSLNYLDGITSRHLELKETQSYIGGIYNNRHHLNSAAWKCTDSLKLISSSLEYQESYCKRKIITLDILNGIAIAIALITGIIIGKMGTRWDE